MINREVELINLARIDLLKGRTDVDRDAISPVSYTHLRAHETS